MNLPPPKVCKRVRALFRMSGSPNENEAARARKLLLELLAKHKLTWNDILAVVAQADAEEAAKAPRGSASSTGPDDPPAVNVLDLVLRLLELHIGLTPAQRMAVGLWTLHTYVFRRFKITPRLALLSPVRGCGKTTLLVLLELVAAAADRFDNITAAAVYHDLETRELTLLVDEGDNLGLLTNPVLRAIFNSGHRSGGVVARYVGGHARKFSVFGPLAIAAIGMLPLPLLDRSIVIEMKRRSPGEPPLERLDESDPAFFASREQIKRWAAQCELVRDPEVPPKLHNRAADNWRVLLAIADDLGHGEEARVAAVELCSGRLDEDPGITLLVDIRKVFDEVGLDRIASALLVARLHALEDGLWHDWRGPRDNGTPHKLSQGELARLLRSFGIRPRTVWQDGRGPGARSSRGYYRSQFESAWASYCPADTATQPSRIIRLLRS
jgi:hypothetical protein